LYHTKSNYKYLQQFNLKNIIFSAIKLILILVICQLRVRSLKFEFKAWLLVAKNKF